MAAEHQSDQVRLNHGPSADLMAMFRDCARDPTEAIQTRLTHMLRTFLQHCKDNSGNEDNNEAAEKCHREAGTMYYRILEKHASHERKRLGVNDISGIFGNENMQCCLVACCLEISIFSNRLPCGFPQLLQTLKLAPYHFLKMIEPVLRAETDLPPASVTHLAQVEEKVLESLAWTRDSPLWEDIRDNQGRLPTCRQVIPPEGRENTDGNLPEGHCLEADQPPSAVNRPQKSHSLHLFARKVYMMMGKRLRELCATRRISGGLRLKIWTCFEHSLVQHTDLMVDRRLDDLLTCAIDIIAKVCKDVLISGGIMENESTGTTNCSDHVDNILTPDTPSAHYPRPAQEERGDLVSFFSLVYSPKMADFAKQFESTPGGETPPLSPYPKQKEASRDKHRLTSGYSIFISALRNTETSSPPTTGLSYTFDRSTPESLHEINNMLRKGTTAKSASCVTLRLDEEEGEEGPSAKRRRVLAGQSALDRRIESVVNERETLKNQGRTSPVTESETDLH